MKKLSALAILPASAIAGMAFAFLIMNCNPAHADIPDAIAAKAEVVVATIHAEGAQVYECKANAAGALIWQFREPIATLIEDGKTVGQHYAGPHWELADGSIVAAKMAARANGATPADIPWLKLEVTKRSGNGRLTDVTAIQRINTKGGVTEGACATAGAFLSVPYTATYVFLRKQ
jgi:Protein of unknown function (DUF3455)